LVFADRRRLSLLHRQGQTWAQIGHQVGQTSLATPPTPTPTWCWTTPSWTTRADRQPGRQLQPGQPL